MTVTWFLAAGLKWGNEAIEQKSPYFHGVAWAIPAAQTVAVLISSKIEGDVFSGVSKRNFFSIKKKFQGRFIEKSDSDEGKSLCHIGQISSIDTW